MPGSRATRRVGLTWPFMLCFSALAAPAFNAIFGLRMPWLHPATLGIAAAIAVVAVAFAAFANRAPRSFRAVLLAMPVLAFVDLAYEGNTLATVVATPIEALGVTGSIARYAAIAVLAGMLTVLAAALADNAALVFGTILTAVFVSTLAFEFVRAPEPGTFMQERRAAADPDRSRGDRPVTVVLLFDELMSVEAFPNVDVPDVVAALRQRILEFHARHGFRIHTRAYSRHYWTRQAIPALVNADYERTTVSAPYLRREQPNDDLLGRGMRNQVIGNELFESYAAKGYEIEVFQSDTMSFCHHEAVSYCATLDSFNPLSAYAPRTTGTRSIIVLGAALKATPDSYVANLLLQALAPVLVESDAGGRIDVIAFPSWFAKVRSHVMNAKPGTLIFAHLLFPHAPYKLTAECARTTGPINPYSIADRVEEAGEIAWTWRSSYAQYYEQVNCLYAELEKLFRSVDTAGRHGDATFILTGDHGSRISKSRYAGEMDSRDLIDNYATHFSIRSPGIEPGVDAAMRPVQWLLGNYLEPRIVNPRFGTEHTVMADVRDGAELVKLSMVSFGSEPGVAGNAQLR